MKKAIIVCILSLIFVPTNIVIAQGSFPYIKKYSASFAITKDEPLPTVIAIQDLNKDGFSDFVVAPRGLNGKLEIRFGNKDASFNKIYIVSQKLNPKTNINWQFSQRVLADVNGDGISDLLELQEGKYQQGNDILALRLGVISKNVSDQGKFYFTDQQYLFELNDWNQKLPASYDKLQAVDYDNDGDLDITCEKTYKQGQDKYLIVQLFNNQGAKVAPEKQFIANYDKYDFQKYSAQRFHNDQDKIHELMYTSDTRREPSSCLKEIPIYEQSKQVKDITIKERYRVPLGPVSTDCVAKINLAAVTEDGYESLVAISNSQDIGRLSVNSYKQQERKFSEWKKIFSSADMYFKDFLTLHADSNGLRDFVLLFEHPKPQTTSAGRGAGLMLIKNYGRLGESEKPDISQYNLKALFSNDGNGNDSGIQKILSGDFNGDGYSDLLVESQHFFGATDQGNIRASEMRVTVLMNHGDWGSYDLLKSLDLYVTNPLTNWSGIYGEKWLQSLSKNELNGGWYFILPDGSFYRWIKDSGAALSKSELIFKFHPSYYSVLRKLVYIQGVDSVYTFDSTKDIAPPPQAFVVKYLLQATKSDFQENWFGLKEKWAYSHFFKSFVYVLPDGRVYKYNKGSNPKDTTGNTLFEQMGPDFYRNLGQWVYSSR